MLKAQNGYRQDLVSFKGNDTNKRNWKFLSKVARTLSLFVLCLFTVVTCAQQPQVLLRVSTVEWSGYEGLYLAQDLDYYKQIPIRLVSHASVADQMQAFRNGEQEAAALTLGDALILAETIPDLRIVLIMDSSNGADGVVAKPGIVNLRDLKNHRVGVEASGLGAYMMTRVLETVNLSPKDVQILVVGGSEHEAAFKQGKVDALITYEPNLSHLVAAGAKELFSTAQIPGEVVDILVVRNTVLNQYKGSLQTLVDGWLRANDYFEKNPQDAARRLAPRTNSTPEQVLASRSRLQFPNLEENQRLLNKSNVKLVQTADRLAKVMLRDHYMKQAIDTKSFLDDQLVRNVRL